MRNVYIFIANDIHVLGGAELYLYGKSKYLESCGWEVKIFFSGKNRGDCRIKYLNKYLSGGIEDLIYPPYRLRSYCIKKVMKQMLDLLMVEGNERVIIESQHDISAFWGELLAKEISGRHFVFCIAEEYRGGYYKTNLDFFKFKLERNELIAPPKTIQLLFDGYGGITKSKIEYPLLVVEAEPIQDVADEEIKFEKADFSICSIGRTEKRYIKYAFQGVKDFANSHQDKMINFIIVGDEKNVNRKEFEALANVRLICLGVLFPIPRSLFSKIDVVIAAAQAALFAARENMYTIVANVTNDTTPGVLGYDTLDAWYGGGLINKSYKEVLDDVLIRHKYRELKIEIPKTKPAEYYYSLQWKFFSMAEKNKEYYTERLSRYRDKNWLAIFPYWAIPPNSQIVIYGFGKVGQDYYRQVKETEYCIISGIVDSNVGKKNSWILPPKEGLENLDYDFIVIAVSKDIYLQDIKEKIKIYAYGKPVIHDVKIFTVE